MQSLGSALRGRPFDFSQATTEGQNHLQRAQQIQQSLMSGGTGGASGGDTASRTKTGSDTGRRTP
jgi:hypothetical protein